MPLNSSLRMDDDFENVSVRSYYPDDEEREEVEPTGDMKQFLAQQVDGLRPSQRRKLAEEVHHILTGEPAPYRQDVERNTSRRTLPKLRFFSGNRTKGEKEVDFASWKIYATSVVDDTAFHDDEKKRVILESLSGPALQVAASLPYRANSGELIEVLNDYYGDVADSYDLYAKFRNSIQEMKETASDFLQRLHLMAIRLVEQGGMLRATVDAEVLRQFENGCADEDLLFRIGVRSLVLKPPTVSLLLRMVRNEEQRRSEKKARLKMRTAASHAVTADTASSVSAQLTSVQSALQHITSRLDEVVLTHSQGGAASSASSSEQPSSQLGGHTVVSQQTFSRSSNKKKSYSRRPTFCYNCGQDGHFANDCTAACNPVLVQQKLIAAAPKRKGNE